MAGVETVSGSRAQMVWDVPKNGRDFHCRLGEGATRARRILDEKTRRALRDVFERVDDRLGNPLRRGLAIIVERRAGMKADQSQSEGRRALELLRETGTRATVLLFLVRRGV